MRENICKFTGKTQKEIDKETLEAIESVKKGKVVSHEEVRKWLESWGTDNELPRPEITE